MENDMEVIKKAREIAYRTYKITSQLPECEKFSLKSQMQRCSISISSNLTEGSERTRKEFINFIRYARGSARELETQLEITSRIYNIKDEVLNELIIDVLKMTYGLLKKVQSDINSTTTDTNTSTE